MKLLTVTIVQSCNQSCGYCPTKRYLYPPDYRFKPDPDNTDFDYFPAEFCLKEKGMPINAIKNKYLLAWLEKYIDPQEWVIEITGGEPGLYPEIDTLIPALDARGYRGVIKTNGSLPIPKSENFIRTAAWHKDKDIPLYYDKILIIKNPKDDWEAKVRHCIKNKIAYRLLDFNFNYDDTGIETKMPKPENDTIIDGQCVIFSMGQIDYCPYSNSTSSERNIYKMSPPLIKDTTKDRCARCVFCLSVESDLSGTGRVE